MSSPASSDRDGRAPRIAVIGCGAISEASHIPALARDPSVRERLVLVDRDRARAEAVARTFGVTETSDDYRAVLSDVDGAVVAVPHHLHVPMSLDCIAAGVHVLCEKPIAETTAEVDQLVAAADEAGVTVTVNNKRRLFASSLATKKLLDGGAIGAPRTFEYYQGAKFDWPAATNSYFGAKGSGKGVLLDLGSHVVDLACWWLGGKPDLVSYEDDSRGGTEAVVRLVFEKDGCRGLIHLSWLTRLRNSFRISGESGAIEGELYDERTIFQVDAKGGRTAIRAAAKVNTGEEIVDRFIDAIAGRGAPPVSARDVAPSIALIEECYANRSDLPTTWYADAAARSA